MIDLTEEITQTVLKIQEAAEAYYTGQSIITDAEFDKLVDHLRELDPDNPILKMTGWGFNPVGNKTNHLYGKVGSLEKYRSVESLREWFSSVSTWGGVISPKYDGLSCVAYYHGDKLIKAATRGNGYEGINISDKYEIIVGDVHPEVISHDLKNDWGIRGELVISNTNWKVLKEKYPNYKNSRNCVAGIINSKEYDQDILQYIEFIPYKLYFNAEEVTYGQISGYRDILDLISKAGFKYAKYRVIASIPTYEQMQMMINSYDYPCDGVVITNESLKVSDESNIDYQQVAFKFEDEKAESKVIDISWNLTRTGKMTPVANIEPVELDGATIRRVTCFNAQYVKDYDLGPGKMITIVRSGEVIPHIVSVIHEYTDGTVEEEFTDSRYIKE